MGLVLLRLGDARPAGLHASLRAAYPRRRLEAAFRAAGVPRDAVVAHVHPDQWVTLVAVLHDLRVDPPRG